MKQDILVPSVGESVTQGTLAAWLKNEGQSVQEGEELFELETDKATVAVPAPASGILHIQVEAGSDVKIGAVVGQRLDEARLKAAVRSSNRARQTQRAMLELLKHRPAPWDGRQLVSFSVNSLLFTGREVKEKLNHAFALEMQRRIEGGTLRPERHRGYWLAWLPTYRSNVFDILKDREVSIPLCETFRIHWEEIDEENPFEGLALKCLNDPFVGPGTRRTDGLERILDDYQIDGVILFATPACRQANAAHALLRDAVARCGRPFLMLDMDISDPRNYSPGQTKTRLEAFVELLEQRRH